MNDLLEAISGRNFPSANQFITDAVVDSRLVIPGALFVALKGEKVDGHDFVGEAFQRGAHAAIIEKDISGDFPQLDLRGGKEIEEPITTPVCLRVENSLKALQTAAHHWRRKLNIRVIGITGSVGKSTTKELIADILSQRYATLKNPGNLNNEIGLPLTILRLTEGHQRAVLEMGFYVPGEISFLCDIALPHIGVITNIGMVHAERAGSMEAIAEGKSELVQALPAAPEGVAILNYDDAYVRPMAEKTKAKVFYYGLDNQADLWADHIESHGLEGISFRLHYCSEVLYLNVPLIGRHSVHTALRATAVGLVEGLTWQEIVQGLRSSHTQLRLSVVRTENGALMIDDSYNASPESTLAALNLLGELDGRKVAVLGDMLELGVYEEKGHELVGVRAAEIVDQLITVGTRGRLIGLAARRSGFPSSRINMVDTIEEATSLLKEILTEGDIVLIKGSHGMRMDRIVSALEMQE
ncbi:MAG: UDP-N-acetylmuramoyl-tripeptide--D-alanyl-D-alanine ligase [Anaerolineales bacterium]